MSGISSRTGFLASLCMAPTSHVGVGAGGAGVWCRLAERGHWHISDASLSRPMGVPISRFGIGFSMIDACP